MYTETSSIGEEELAVASSTKRVCSNFGNRPRENDRFARQDIPNDNLQKWLGWPVSYS
jgi:hypothetical protein